MIYWTNCDPHITTTCYCKIQCIYVYVQRSCAGLVHLFAEDQNDSRSSDSRPVPWSCAGLLIRFPISIHTFIYMYDTCRYRLTPTFIHKNSANFPNFFYHVISVFCADPHSIRAKRLARARSRYVNSLQLARPLCYSHIKSFYIWMQLGISFFGRVWSLRRIWLHFDVFIASGRISTFNAVHRHFWAMFWRISTYSANFGVLALTFWSFFASLINGSQPFYGQFCYKTEGTLLAFAAWTVPWLLPLKCFTSFHPLPHHIAFPVIYRWAYADIVI